MLSKEEVKEIIYTKFKGRAVDEDSGLCSYLNAEGKKCFIGLFIPDYHVCTFYSDYYPGYHWNVGVILNCHCDELQLQA